MYIGRPIKSGMGDVTLHQIWYTKTNFYDGLKFFMTGLIVVMLAYGRSILRKNVPLAHAETLNAKGSGST